MPKPEIFRGAAVVRLELINRASVRGARVMWSQPIPQTLYFPVEAHARAFCERVAAGEAPLAVLTDVLDLKRRRIESRHKAKAGAASWAKLTPEERKARARANAVKRWGGEICAACGMVIRADARGAWIDNTGGDGCGDSVHAPAARAVS